MTQAAPVQVIPPPEKEEEQIPLLDDLIKDKRTRLELARYLSEERQYAEAEAAAKKARKPLTTRIKNILGKYSVGRAQWGDWMINYYGSPRTSISEKDLRNALLVAGLQPDQIKNICAACIKTSTSYALRISKPDGGEEEE